MLVKRCGLSFCDISKAFDRVWHTGLLYKFRAAGVTGNILQWFKNYLSDWKQRFLPIKSCSYMDKHVC